MTKEEKDEYIRQENILLAGNISEYSIDEVVLDRDGRDCRITDKTANSLEVFIEAKDIKKSYAERKGVSHKEWFYIKDFNSRFKKI